MKRIKILGIIMLIVGIISILVGIYLNKKQVANNYMENTTINIKREKCLQGICVSNLVIDNGTGRSTNIKFKVVNKSNKTIINGEINLYFDDNNIISYQYEKLVPKEVVEVKKVVRNNLGYVTDYELKKKN